MITVMIAGCIEDAEDKKAWIHDFTRLIKRCNDEIELKFVEDIIEVGFHLQTTDFVVIGSDLKEYEEDLKGMAENKTIIVADHKFGEPKAFLEYLSKAAVLKDIL